MRQWSRQGDVYIVEESEHFGPWQDGLGRKGWGSAIVFMTFMMLAPLNASSNV